MATASLKAVLALNRYLVSIAYEQFQQFRMTPICRGLHVCQAFIQSIETFHNREHRWFGVWNAGGGP
jgi:hypothetical protein